MKLVTFRTTSADGHPQDRAGLLVEPDPPTVGQVARVLDLAHGLAWIERRAGRKWAAADVNERFGRGVLGFIEHADLARPAADELVRAWRDRALPDTFEGRMLVHAYDRHALRAPLPDPPSLRDGYAFRAHVEAARRSRGLGMIAEFDDFPVFYFANHRSIVGPGDVRVQRAHLDRLDYELEAAIVVGGGGKNLSLDAADGAILGMAVMNDWSARAMQQAEMKLGLGPAKGKDFATSLGPWLVTIDELLPRARRVEGRGLVFDMEMQASVNDKALSRGNLKDMTWTFSQILQRASYGVELRAGDVVGSGTCGTGCLLELNGSGGATDMWLSPGDVVRLEIDGLGRLENRVVVDADG